MKSFWRYQKKVAQALRSARGLLLCFDFDGTLSPIAQTPDRARLPRSTRDLLAKLCLLPNVDVAIISGRDFDDIAATINNPNIIVAGNHGLTWERQGKRHIHAVPQAVSKQLDSVEKQMKLLISHFPGALIERKRMSVCFHYRRLAPASAKQFVRDVHTRIDSFAAFNNLALQHGKKVLEVVPDVAWNKGALVITLKRQLGDPVVFFMGDDQTDEDVFVAATEAITVRVGKSSRSKASYYIKNQTFVDRILGWLLSEISSLQ